MGNQNWTKDKIELQHVQMYTHIPYRILNDKPVNCSSIAMP